MAGEGQHQVTLLVDFLVVNVPSVHNVILGRPSLNATRTVVSIYHLMMKFPVKHALTINVLDTTEDPPENLETIPFEEANLSKTVLLESLLNSEQRSQLSMFLQQHRDVFAWLHENMPSISPDVMVHRLNVDLDPKPVKQKRRVFNAERYVTIADEVSKLLSVGFIEEIHYPDWIINVVLVKKSSGKW
ncbi:uncharacterized protein LOC131238868 [Magnolia sinica]|uniref:uncharacterized protein LOC131238868 n=1 Tax=Magnolia sinica TaxID=86752 RepID=UPI002659DC6F|nr:uncharacterized protein LOC131238868 [Magnolia sinica]